MKQSEPALSPQQRLEGDLKRAMKARDQERVQTLRMLLSAVKNRRIELGSELDESELLTLVKRAAKQRREAAEQFQQGGREELAAQEERELLILEEYLPAQIDEQTLRQAVTEYVAAEGLSGPRAMGQVMPVMIERFQGAADGKLLSRIVREALGV
jgi:uncharacterized protein YqeY